MYSIDDLSKSALHEFMDLACGDRIGYGMSRTVYRYTFDDTKVIKIENSTNHFQNVIEWEFWRTNQYYDKLAKWLAPCHYISHSGTFLIMDYAKDIEIEDIPDKLPSFMTDLKIGNFGMIDGKVVLRDYGTTLSNPSMRLKKAEVSGNR